VYVARPAMILRVVASQDAHLGFDVRGNIDDEGRLQMKPQMHAKVVNDFFRKMRFARHIRLAELGPEAGRYPRAHWPRHDPGARLPSKAQTISAGAVDGWRRPGWRRASSPACRDRFGKPRLPRQSSCKIAVAAAVSRWRVSGLPWGVGSPSVRSSTPTRKPCAFKPAMVPPKPSSAVVGMGSNHQVIQRHACRDRLHELRLPGQGYMILPVVSGILRAPPDVDNWSKTLGNSGAGLRFPKKMPTLCR